MALKQFNGDTNFNNSGKNRNDETRGKNIKTCVWMGNKNDLNYRKAVISKFKIQLIKK